MDTREYRTINKSTWGDGPWQNEPDKRQWKDEATGLPCLIVRSPGAGNLCGYVGVPVGHPAHGLDYDDVNVEVHGGLTFAKGCSHGGDESRYVCHVPGEGEPDDVWWLGFDCAHAWDVSPGYMALYPGWPKEPDSRYRDFCYVTQQCANLARQLSAMAASPANALVATCSAGRGRAVTMEKIEEQVWKHRFAVYFAERLSQSGYNSTETLECAYQHANASWPERDLALNGEDAEECAQAEYDALSDSV